MAVSDVLSEAIEEIDRYQNHHVEGMYESIRAELYWMKRQMRAMLTFLDTPPPPLARPPFATVVGRVPLPKHLTPARRTSRWPNPGRLPSREQSRHAGRLRFAAGASPSVASWPIRRKNVKGGA